MKKGTVIAIVIGVIAVILISLIGGYNSLVSKEAEVEQQAANIDTQLQRRADLIPNLVNTVKGYTNHETEVFSQVTEAREKLMSAGTMAEKSAANDEVSAALGRLIAVAENYPELKSDTVYINLMDELAGTENRIAKVRKDYNEVTTSYNKAIKKFPGVIFAGIFGFEKADLFEAAEGAATAPTVDFE